MFSPPERIAIDREVLMAQDSSFQTLEFPPLKPATAPNEVVPWLIGSSVGEIERELVQQTLARCDGIRTRAARVLGVSVRTLRNKIRQYTADGIEVQRPGGTLNALCVRAPPFETFGSLGVSSDPNRPRLHVFFFAPFVFAAFGNFFYL